MTGIPVTVEPPTEARRLQPRYKNSIGILTLESALPRICPHGVNIDGMLMLDFDEKQDSNLRRTDCANERVEGQVRCCSASW